jgi:hypothetical protein
VKIGIDVGLHIVVERAARQDENESDRWMEYVVTYVQICKIAAIVINVNYDFL